MPIDFTQIQSGEDFELLCEDLLRARGFTIVHQPARGPEGGKDLIVSERFTDLTGATEERKTLVQCKHHARSGKAVSFNDVANYRDVMDEYGVRRYLLITSTVPTEDLREKFAKTSEKGEYVARIWSKGDLARYLNDPPDVRERHFPSAAADWHIGTPEIPQVSLLIHGWTKQRYDLTPTVELDWTEHFDRPTRRVPDQQAWDDVLFPDLERAKAQLNEMPEGRYIDFRGRLPLTAVLAVGATFPEVGGYSFRAEQPTPGGTYLWRSTAQSSNCDFKVCEEQGTHGRDLLVAFCITDPAWGDVERLYKESGFNAVAYMEPDNGPRNDAIGSAGDAVAFAIRAKALIRKFQQKYRASCTHLVLFGPATFGLFLGQRLNALGDIVGYERTVDGKYRPSIRLRTG